MFLQGCPMRCLYCHNPDSWCGGGTPYEARDVIQRMTRNLPFYQTGGITVSGGEPLLQIDFLIELFTLAKAQKIHTCLDTSGITFDKNDECLLKKFDRLISVCDLVMLDIKHIDNEEHIRLTGHSNEHVLDFARYLNENGVPMRVRHVIVPNITYKEEYLRALGSFLADFSSIEKIEVLPFHEMGEVKYDQLGIEYRLKDTPQLSTADASNAYEIIKSAM